MKPKRILIDVIFAASIFGVFASVCYVNDKVDEIDNAVASWMKDQMTKK